MKKEAGKLLGFRSDTPWKKGIALIYYSACFIFFMIAMITPPLIPASSADTVITKISSFILTLMLLSPALFLSDTFLRNTLPFFKVKSFLSSLTGLLIVWAFLMYFFLCSESLHSPEYKTQFNAFISASYDSFVEAGTNDFIQIDPIE